MSRIKRHGLSLLLALGLTACGGEESQPAPDPQPDPAPASEPVQEAPSLSQLREEAQNAGADAAIAFLGSLSQGEAMSDFLSGSSLVKDYPFLADMDDFAAFNEVYAKYFTTKPARSCVAVKSLPKGVLCEIEAIAAK